MREVLQSRTHCSAELNMIFGLLVEKIIKKQNYAKRKVQSRAAEVLTPFLINLILRFGTRFDKRKINAEIKY